MAVMKRVGLGFGETTTYRYSKFSVGELLNLFGCHTATGFGVIEPPIQQVIMQGTHPFVPKPVPKACGQVAGCIPLVPHELAIMQSHFSACPPSRTCGRDVADQPATLSIPATVRDASPSRDSSEPLAARPCCTKLDKKGSKSALTSGGRPAAANSDRGRNLPYQKGTLRWRKPPYG